MEANQENYKFLLRKATTSLMGVFALASLDIGEIAERLNNVYDGKQGRPLSDIREFIKEQATFTRNTTEIKRQLAIYVVDLVTGSKSSRIDQMSVMSRISEVFGEDLANNFVESIYEYKNLTNEPFDTARNITVCEV